MYRDSRQDLATGNGNRVMRFQLALIEQCGDPSHAVVPRGGQCHASQVTGHAR